MSGFDYRTQVPRGSVRPGRVPTPGSTSRRIGKSGNVRLAVDVTPDVKDALIRRAEREGTTLVAITRSALLSYLLREMA